MVAGGFTALVKGLGDHTKYDIGMIWSSLHLLNVKFYPKTISFEIFQKYRI